MRPLAHLLAPALLGLAAGPLHAAPPPPAAPVAVRVTEVPGAAGTVDCMIRFEVANGFREHRIEVGMVVNRFGLRNLEVVWGENDGTTRWLEPGEDRAWYQTLSGRCGARRRYSFFMWAHRGDEEPAYATLTIPPPSPSYDWYTGRTVWLGDLSERFPDLEPAASPAPAPEEAPPEPAPEPAPAPAPEPTPAPAPAPVPEEAPPTGGPALFAEDFGGLAEGGFPDAFEYLGGSMRVTSVEGRPMLEMDGEGWFRVPLPAPLPERFTVAFDYRAPPRFSFLYVAPFDAARATGRPGVPNYRAIPAHHFVLTPETSGTGVSGGTPDLPRAAAMNAAFGAGVVPVRLVVEGDAAAVFVAGEPVARLPRAVIARTSAVEVYYRSNRGPGYLGALRVTSD